MIRRAHRDKIIKGTLHREVLKVWNGIVSVPDYSLNKCFAGRLNLSIYFERPDGQTDRMFIKYEDLRSRVFRIHKKPIISRIPNGPTYEMYDFGWAPDPLEKEPEQQDFFNNSIWAKEILADTNNPTVFNKGVT